jgi:hypothetical protein
MIESPVLNEFIQEERRLAILDFLIARFGPAADAVRPALDAIADNRTLRELTTMAGLCPDIETFKERLVQLAPKQHENP